ncbi:mobilization protein [Spirosoma sp. HMF4905]|uniref:Mobilization protein n=1 Tax=Spirosoma arboris TaxID=2682092 RepID=A0A7K1SM31_9BACT|nr:CHC2 zinc finger domain-containing protein [Spirosoma arboris]MVM34862.1 mobilization protein [Spirosoma arboris]
MIPLETIEKVKNVSITSYLQSKGILPAHQLADKKEYAYCSPLSGERTPSFFVNYRDNVFNDSSTGEKGDIIRLVQKLEKISFFEAVRRLQAFVGINEPIVMSPYSIASDKALDTTFRITANRTLQHPALIKYLEEKRGIPFAYANPWVRQIHYTRKDKPFFGIGFRTNSGTWAIRNEAFKTWIGKTDITTIHVENTTTLNLFEGFINFLSALTLYKKHGPAATTIILNSVTNLKSALPVLSNYESVNCYLDNDRAGKKAVVDMGIAGIKTIDRSNLYADYNDLNDFLLARL